MQNILTFKTEDFLIIKEFLKIEEEISILMKF